MTPEERARALFASEACWRPLAEAREGDTSALEAYIAAAIRAAVQAERERCAKIAEVYPPCIAARVEKETCVGDEIAATIREGKA